MAPEKGVKMSPNPRKLDEESFRNKNSLMKMMWEQLQLTPKDMDLIQNRKQTLIKNSDPEKMEAMFKSKFL